MTFGTDPFGTVPFAAGGPTYTVVRDAIDSADWTGIEHRLESDSAAVRHIETLVFELDLALDQAGLTNAERAKARSMTQAIVALVQSPEPEWKVIARLLMTLLDSKPVKASLNAAKIAGLIGAALKLIGVL